LFTLRTSKKNVPSVKVKIIPNLFKLKRIFGVGVVENDIKKQINLDLREKLNREGVYKHLFHAKS